MLGYYGSYDVVVCGGGTSGVPAAIAAARAGAKTLLIERVGQLGGQMNFSGPPGFAYAFLFNGRGEQIIGGFAQETHKRLLEAGHALPHLRPKWRGQFTFSYVDPDWWGLLVYEMMKENNVELMLHTMVTDVILDGNVVKGVVTAHPSGKSIVLAKVVIDCTGEGEVSYLAGAEYDILPKDQLEPSTVAFTVDGVDWDKVLAYVKSNIDDFIFDQVLLPYNGMTVEDIKKEVLKAESILDIGEIMGFEKIRVKALETGEWHGNSGIGFFLMPKEGGRVLAHFQHSSHVGNADCTDVRDLTYVEVEARMQDIIAWKCIKKYLPGFENAYITRVCPEVRIRETRRIICDYVLTADDVVEARKFDDVIGKSSFPVGGKHAVGDRALTLEAVRLPKDGGSHDIPYRALVVKGLENLLVAGKAISTDRPSHHRFLQQTTVTGTAAGVAAAVAARRGVTPRALENDLKEVQEILIKQGAILYGTH
ncbi:MAG TPA: FAD-dependent oxidoreductase [Thermoclostridium sp.]|nr:FAD-dependent oxidoreductase [Clostridiaceae bacterium]HOQ75391.1 FAD-dependent oxidoreductase [Thermoclostridium sp.]HPU44631.1 FAD-dependent oxidoreductase [Thermoclostridium sp.]